MVNYILFILAYYILRPYFSFIKFIGVMSLLAISFPNAFIHELNCRMLLLDAFLLMLE